MLEISTVRQISDRIAKIAMTLTVIVFRRRDGTCDCQYQKIVGTARLRIE
jgi:hypothetical protein